MDNEFFEYSYSAKEQEEVKKIREKYIQREAADQEDKMHKLRRLDASVNKKANMISLALGIAGVLVFGTGMCCCLVWNEFLIGITVGALGGIILAVAYPVYMHIVKTERAKLAPEILRLTDELMK